MFFVYIFYRVLLGFLVLVLQLAPLGVPFGQLLGHFSLRLFDPGFGQVLVLLNVSKVALEPLFLVISFFLVHFELLLALGGLLLVVGLKLLHLPRLLFLLILYVRCFHLHLRDVGCPEGSSFDHGALFLDGAGVEDCLLKKHFQQDLLVHDVNVLVQQLIL